jgi:hypothetical protein
MRKSLLTVVVLIVAGSIGAQEARVIPLKSEDAAHARCTWERLQKAQKEWDDVQESVRNDYVLVPENDKDASNVVLSIQGGAHTYRRGFESGFEFSSDFKYIVPKAVNYTTVQPCTSFLANGSCFTWKY